VVQELYAAQQALHAMDSGRRQLSAQQVRALLRARNTHTGLTWLLGFLILTLVLGGGSCGAIVLSAFGATKGAVLFFITMIFPAVILVAGGGLLLRAHRRSVAELAGTCAAAPPAAADRPAMCHVCGAPLLGHVHRGLTRCNYCHADNIVDAYLMRAAATREDVVANTMAQAVAQHATKVSAQSNNKFGLTLALAIVAPLVACAVAVAIAIMLDSIPVSPDLNETYAVVQVAGTRCYVESSGALPAGIPFPHGLTISTKNASSKIRASDLLSHEVLIEQNQVVTPAGFTRTLLDDTNQIKLPDGKQIRPGGVCEKPPNLMQLSHDPRLESCVAMYPHGSNLFVFVGRTLYRVPKSGGPLVQVAELEGGEGAGFSESDIRRSGDRVVIIHNTRLETLDLNATSTPIPVTPHPGGATGVTAISAAGERIVYATHGGIFFEAEDHSTFSQLARLKRRAVAIAASGTHVYWASSEGLQSLPLLGGTPKLLIQRPDLSAVTVVGPNLMIRGDGCSVLPVEGGTLGHCPYIIGSDIDYRHAPFTDATHGYLISTSSDERAGLQAFSLSDPGKFQRLYGPTAKSVSCAAVDDEYAYWVDGPYLQRDKKQQP